jgi:septation ring formation regulator EzrA
VKSSAVSGADVHAARKNVQRIERRLAKIEEALAVVAQRTEAAGADYSLLQELMAEATALNAEQQQLEDEWLALSEIIS